MPGLAAKLSDAESQLASERTPAPARHTRYSNAAPETQSPAALARRLAEATGDAHVRDLAAATPDDDARLAQALARAHAALGFALAPESNEAATTTPVLARGRLDLTRVWSGGGLYPIPALAKSAALGALSLPGDPDGIVRRAPLLVATGDALRPGLALETVRLALGRSAYLLTPDPPQNGPKTVNRPIPDRAVLSGRSNDPTDSLRRPGPVRSGVPRHADG